MHLIKIFSLYSKEDKIIAFSVLIQPLLVVFQFLLISVFLMPEEQTTKYRVLLTAFPMLIAIILCLKRKFVVFLWTFIILFLFLFFEFFLFPANGSYIFSDSFRFLVPVIIPSILCLSSLKNINIIEDVLFFYSWIIVGMTLLFVISFLQGRAEFLSYNMGLSYALLLPMVILYKKGGILSYLGATLCFFCILVFGSRGALVAGVLYFLYDIVKKNKRNLVYILFLSFFLISIAIALSDYLESLGISSRTLNLIIGGGISSAEGRDTIYPKALMLISENWFTGVGIYGDRVYMGEYCHNIILEILLDYGVVFGSFIILLLFIFLTKLYFKLDEEHKNIYVKYLIVLLLPLFTSGSYLIDFYMGVFGGIIILLNNYANKNPNRTRVMYMKTQIEKNKS